MLVQCPAFWVKPALTCCGSQLNMEQASNIWGLLLPADAAGHIIWAAPQKSFNLQHLPRDCPEAHPAVPITPSQWIFPAPPQCKTKPMSQNLSLLLEAELRSVWHPKVLRHHKLFTPPGTSSQPFPELGCCINSSTALWASSTQTLPGTCQMTEIKID